MRSLVWIGVALLLILAGAAFGVMQEQDPQRRAEKRLLRPVRSVLRIAPPASDSEKLAVVFGKDEAHLGIALLHGDASPLMAPLALPMTDSILLQALLESPDAPALLAFTVADSRGWTDYFWNVVTQEVYSRLTPEGRTQAIEDEALSALRAARSPLARRVDMFVVGQQHSLLEHALEGISAAGLRSLVSPDLWHVRALPQGTGRYPMLLTTRDPGDIGVLQLRLYLLSQPDPKLEAPVMLTWDRLTPPRHQGTGYKLLEAWLEDVAPPPGKELLVRISTHAPGQVFGMEEVRLHLLDRPYEAGGMNEILVFTESYQEWIGQAMPPPPPTAGPDGSGRLAASGVMGNGAYISRVLEAGGKEQRYRLIIEEKQRLKDSARVQRKTHRLEWDSSQQRYPNPMEPEAEH